MCPRCSLTRPWQVIICAPARSSILAYSTVFSTVGKTLNFAVTGTDRFLCNVLTIFYGKQGRVRFGPQGGDSDRRLLISCINSQSSWRNAPYFPFLAISWGHPRLISTASQYGSRTFAEVRICWGSFPQNWAINGRSSCPPSSPFRIEKFISRKVFFVAGANI